jgi:rSAM/selenodomain-associated transferase 2
MKQLISIIIPAIDEGATLGNTLSVITGVAGVETIMVDGGSRDNSREIAAAQGARIIASPSGRAVQMNTGAAAAHGEILLFLHADCLLPRGFAEHIHNSLAARHTAAGAFRLAIDAPNLSMRVLEQLIYWRSHFLQMVYGDQALFMTAAMFHATGGFPELPLMEDFEFVRRLRRHGRIAVLDQTVTTSARRWQRLGLIRTTATNQLIVAAYLLGVDPERLARWYRKPAEGKNRIKNGRSARL